MFEENLGIEYTHYGCGGFTRIQWRHRRAELTFYIGEDGFRTGPMVRETLLVLLRRGFLELGFNKVTWPVYGHDPSLDSYTSIFNTEAILKEEYFWDGQFQDRYYLSLTRREFDKIEDV